MIVKILCPLVHFAWFWWRKIPTFGHDFIIFVGILYSYCIYFFGLAAVGISVAFFMVWQQKCFYYDNCMNHIQFHIIPNATLPEVVREREYVLMVYAFGWFYNHGSESHLGILLASEKYAAFDHCAGNNKIQYFCFAFSLVNEMRNSHRQPNMNAYKKVHSKVHLPNTYLWIWENSHINLLF